MAIYVRSAYQGKGYGKEALNKAIEFLKQENLFDYIQINYVEENLVAKNFIKKLVFQKREKWKETKLL